MTNGKVSGEAGNGRSKVTFKMPRELYDSLQRTIEGTGFGSVNEFVVFVMRTVAKGGRLDGSNGFSPEDMERVRQRLSDLGYIK